MIKKLLILDDSQTITSAIAEYLNDAGYKDVLVANTVREAKRLLSPEVDLTLVDVILHNDPDKETGEDFAKYVKQNNRNCWIILMTGHRELVGSLSERLREEVDEVIEKPHKLSELVNVINKYSVIGKQSSGKSETTRYELRLLRIEIDRLKETLGEDHFKFENFNKRISDMETTVTKLTTAVSGFISKHEKDAMKIILAFVGTLVTLFGLAITIGLFMFNHMMTLMKTLQHMP